MKPNGLRGSDHRYKTVTTVDVRHCGNGTKTVGRVYIGIALYRMGGAPFGL